MLDDAMVDAIVMGRVKWMHPSDDERARAKRLVVGLGEQELVSEACMLAATADSKAVQPCVMAQIEYMRPATASDTDLDVPIGTLRNFETLTCGDPTSPEFRKYMHDTLDEYFKYATAAPAWNRFWIGGAVCSQDVHRPKYNHVPDPKNGLVLTVGEFRRNVKAGGFIDYDGYGHPMLDGRADRTQNIFPSEVAEIPADATHIVWYNR